MIRATLALLLFIAPAWAQSPSAAKSVKDAHDLRGIWQAKGNAYRNLEAEKGVIVDPANGKIPYRAEVRSTADRNFQARATTDPLPRDAISRAVYAVECVMVTYLTLWLSRNSFNRFAGITRDAILGDGSGSEVASGWP